MFPEEDAGSEELLDLFQEKNRDASCVQVSAAATLVKRPVDVIFVIDNSGSMTDEIVGVEKNINTNFAAIMAKSKLDYRVIMVTRHGVAAQGQSICVDKPLSGHTCNPPPLVPVNTKIYFHYNTEIASTDSFKKIIATYNVPDLDGNPPAGWSSYLRKDSFKAFIEITDDGSTITAAAFEPMLFALQPALFGDMKKRNYSWHTIAGLKENMPPQKPWGPKDPIQANKCTLGGGAVNNGIEHQTLRIATGGLRFPICEWASFDGVFQEVAAGIVQGASVSCDFPIPMPPDMQQIDFDTVLLEYTPGKGAPEDFLQVADLGKCAPNSFYLTGSKIVLCPETCTKVQKDYMAKFRVLFDCVTNPS
ncbi:MAG: hypothetical protein EXR72_25630 [Myxococcales bacterium]|nr:hypothetical protein [Myxococcales bacterium]